jgi:hypothetical protein
MICESYLLETMTLEKDFLKQFEFILEEIFRLKLRISAQLVGIYD